MYIDTHSHLYDTAFDGDREEVIRTAKEHGVGHIALPNIDVESIQALTQLHTSDPDFFWPMLGLHPCSVNENYVEQLDLLQSQLDQLPICAIGEIGLDFYWDKTFIAEQEDAFIRQCHWASDLDLPIVIHSRESLDRIIDLVTQYPRPIRGVFHCFTGTLAQAKSIIDLGFYLGIGGVLTFKNSGLREVIAQLSLDHLVLETDAPYLSPTPFRGKRNEPKYMLQVAETLATLFETKPERVGAITSENAFDLYGKK